MDRQAGYVPTSADLKKEMARSEDWGDLGNRVGRVKALYSPSRHTTASPGSASHTAGKGIYGILDVIVYRQDDNAIRTSKPCMSRWRFGRPAARETYH